MTGGRLRRFPTYIAKGLLVQKILQLLKSAGIVFEPYYFYQEGPFVPGTANPPEHGNDFVFAEIGMESFPEISSIDSLNPSREELTSRFLEGGRCFALKQGDRVVAFSWCNTKTITFDPCRRPLGPREAYLYGAETLFEFRGMRLQPYLRSLCYRELRGEGRDVVYSYSDYFNYPALRFKERLGSRILFVGLHVTIFGKWKWSTILRRMGEVVEPGGSVA